MYYASYSTFTRYNAYGGNVFPALVRSFDAMISGISSGFILPSPNFY